MEYFAMFVMFVSAAYAMYAAAYFLAKWERANKKKKTDPYERLVPKRIDPSRLCQDGHKWINAAMLNEEQELVETNICSDCGLLPSRDLMVTKEGIESIIRSNLEREINYEIHSQFSEAEENEMKKLFEEELKNGLNVEKLWGVYHAGMTAPQRLAFYKMARLEELEVAKAKNQESI